LRCRDIQSSAACVHPSATGRTRQGRAGHAPCFIITCRNFTTTLETGRSSTWRLPRFSALYITLRASANTLMRTMAWRRSKKRQNTCWGGDHASSRGAARDAPGMQTPSDASPVSQAYSTSAGHGLCGGHPRWFGFRWATLRSPPGDRCDGERGRVCSVDALSAPTCHPPHAPPHMTVGFLARAACGAHARTRSPRGALPGDPPPQGLTGAPIRCPFHPSLTPSALSKMGRALNDRSCGPWGARWCDPLERSVTIEAASRSGLTRPDARVHAVVAGDTGGNDPAAGRSGRQGGGCRLG